MTPEIKHTLDGAAATGAWASFAGILHDVFATLAAIASLVWFGIRVYEWWRERQGK